MRRDRPCPQRPSALPGSRRLSRFGVPVVLLALVVLVPVLVTAGPTQATAGVFSLDRLRLGSSTGPEDVVFTDGNVMVPDGGVDPGTYYRFVVTDPSGTVRNPTFPCTPASQFTSSDNSYTVASTDPLSTATPWKYTLNQYVGSTCATQPAKTVSKTFYVARAAIFADSALTSRRTDFTPGATSYMTVGGLNASINNWSVTWITPSSSTACANTAGADRPATNGSGTFPKTPGGFLQYRPSATAAGATWNRESNYELRP